MKMTISFHPGMLLALLLAVPAGAAPMPLLAAEPRPAAASRTITVNSQLDEPDSDPFDGACRTPTSIARCTLRAAIMEANHTSGGNAAIVVPAGTYELTIAPAGGVDETTGDLNLLQPMTIQGAGAGSTIVDGGGQDRVMLLGEDAISVTLLNLTIRNGATNGYGGGILSYSHLTLSRVAVSGNYAASGGGGIANGSILSLYQSLVEQNRTDSDGGGIWVVGSGTLEAENSTLSNNSAEIGGGIYNEVNGDVTLTFVTVAGNLADSDAGGSGNGGGIYNYAGHIHLYNTLLAENLVGLLHRDCAGNAIELANANLIQNTAGCTLTITGSGNQLGVDPLLLPLQNNGGPTLTRALLAGSPAIDAGTAFCSGLYGIMDVDQRGATRPAGGLCDTGAYEGSVPSGLTGRNLIRNGDAELAAGSPSGGTAGWPGWALNPAAIPRCCRMASPCRPAGCSPPTQARPTAGTITSPAGWRPTPT